MRWPGSFGALSHVRLFWLGSLTRAAGELLALIGLRWSQLGLTLPCIMYPLILQHLSELIIIIRQNSKRGSESMEGLWKPRFGTGTLLHLPHFIGQNK